jgi:hypothetical protein
LYGLGNEDEKEYKELKKISISSMVGVIGPNWNQIKRELVAMWQIVNKVRKETPITV